MNMFTFSLAPHNHTLTQQNGQTQQSTVAGRSQGSADKNTNGT